VRVCVVGPEYLPLQMHAMPVALRTLSTPMISTLVIPTKVVQAPSTPAAAAPTDKPNIHSNTKGVVYPSR
jgi:hypothetical protein